ncbi:MAG: exodeoxyribonuclease VII large subunit, partial [Erysipelotrichaceae bacterium]|nr:exodeoxyribonuclease VII large subunit [Erysipelotrichaceae bacterium]
MQQISVSALLRYLKNKLDTDDNLQKLYVQGEISNFHRHFSGHLYFTLKDEKAAISCVMFKSAAVSLRFEPKNGDKVVVYANTSIFEASGQLQLYVQTMTPEGLGDLYARYEALKKKLSAEGKFAEEH